LNFSFELNVEDPNYQAYYEAAQEEIQEG